MDNIFVTGLRVPTTIGVHAWEQKIKQTLVLDLELQVDVARAGATDDLAHTVDYWQLCTSIKTLLASRSFMLIEAVAEQVAQIVLSEFLVACVTVQVAKPSVASDLTQVAVKITRMAKA